jgi:AAA+ superfamily predicted ATPase
LEYFEGIMFLTTNRVSSFDSAFRSRIHLAIKYPALAQSSQRVLWITFVTGDFQRPRPLWLTESFLDAVSAEGLNGRQIKNVVRVATPLAASADREMQAQDIRVSLDAMKAFEADFTEHGSSESEGGVGTNASQSNALLGSVDRSKRRRLA